MRELELRGVRRGRSTRTTVSDENAVRAADLVCRQLCSSIQKLTTVITQKLTTSSLSCVLSS